MDFRVWSSREKQYVNIEIPDEEVVSVRNILKTHQAKSNSGMTQEEFENSDYIWIEMTQEGCNIFDSYNL